MASMLSLIFLITCSQTEPPNVDLQTPTELSVVQVGLDEFQLEWKDNSTNETGYRIERKFEYSQFEEIAAIGTNKTQFTDNIPYNKPTGETVSYRIYSFYNHLQSNSRTSLTTIDFPAPSDFFNSQAQGTNEITLNWTDNSNGESGFIIDIKTNDGPFEQFAVVDSNITSLSIIALDHENEYFLRAKAFSDLLLSSNSNVIKPYSSGNIIYADFTADIATGYDDIWVDFYDLSSEDAISWYWEFENGTSRNQNPSRSFSAGMHTISLTVSNGQDESKTTKIDYIIVKHSNSFFEEGFEDYDNFSIDFPPWSQVDADGADTFGMSSAFWPNMFSPQSFIVFNANVTFPPLQSGLAHSGEKFAACFAAENYFNKNNDWMFSPKIEIGSENIVSFWARSYSAPQVYERFEVGYNLIDSTAYFYEVLSEGTYLEAPLEWTKYSFDLSPYAGEEVYIGIHCISQDGFMLMIDDFEVGIETD